MQKHRKIRIFVNGRQMPGVYLSGHTEPTEISGTCIETVRNLNEVSAISVEAVAMFTEVTGSGIGAVHKIRGPDEMHASAATKSSSHKPIKKHIQTAMTTVK